MQTQEHLGVNLYKKLSFKEHLKDKFAKVNRGIGTVRKLSGFLPCHSLITLYKFFIRPHLDYVDIIYDQSNNLNLCNIIETCQYNAALAITGDIKGSLKDLAQLTRNSHNIKHIFCRLEYFANSFFLYAIKEWNKLSLEIRNSESYSIFKKSLLKFIRTIPNSVFNVADIYGIKLLTRLRVGLSHLREHKCRHDFQDTINPICSCSREIESTSHFFLRCQISSPQESIS